MSGHRAAVCSRPCSIRPCKRASGGDAPFFRHPLETVRDLLQPLLELQPAGGQRGLAIIGEGAAHGGTLVGHLGWNVP
jgi:hypothetical protein